MITHAIKQATSWLGDHFKKVTSFYIQLGFFYAIRDKCLIA